MKESDRVHADDIAARLREFANDLLDLAKDLGKKKYDFNDSESVSDFVLEFDEIAENIKSVSKSVDQYSGELAEEEEEADADEDDKDEDDKDEEDETAEPEE